MGKACAEDEDGQATVELVAVLPVLGVVGVLAWQALVAGQTWWLAAAAGREAARAHALGQDPAAAARRVLPHAPHLSAQQQADGSIRLRLGSATVRARMGRSREARV